MAIFSMFQFDKDFPQNVFNENFSFTIFDDRINSSFFFMFMFQFDKKIFKEIFPFTIDSKEVTSDKHNF